MQPERDVRRGYQEHLESWRQQLRSWRSDGVGRLFQLSNGKDRWPRQMTDQEIDEVARAEAEKDIIRAENEWAASETRRRMRAGIAL